MKNKRGVRSSNDFSAGRSVSRLLRDEDIDEEVQALREEALVSAQLGSTLGGGYSPTERGRRVAPKPNLEAYDNYR
jgi:hypothetical protein